MVIGVYSFYLYSFTWMLLLYIGVFIAKKINKVFRNVFSWTVVSGYTGINITGSCFRFFGLQGVNKILRHSRIPVSYLLVSKKLAEGAGNSHGFFSTR